MGRARAFLSVKLKRIGSRREAVRHGLLYAAVGPSTLALWVTVRQQHTHAYMRTVFSRRERAECREEEKRGAASTPRCFFCCQKQWPTFSPGEGKKKKKRKKVQQTENLGGLGGKEKGKGKEWEKQKEHVQEGINRASEKTEGWRRVVVLCVWGSSRAPVAQFFFFFWTCQATIRAGTSFWFPMWISVGVCAENCFSEWWYWEIEKKMKQKMEFFFFSPPSQVTSASRGQCQVIWREVNCCGCFTLNERWTRSGVNTRWDLNRDGDVFPKVYQDVAVPVAVSPQVWRAHLVFSCTPEYLRLLLYALFVIYCRIPLRYQID